MILTMPFAKNRKMEFIPTHGIIQEVPEGSAASATGNMHLIENRCVAVYAENGVLYFQMDQARWPLDEKLSITYRHEVPTQTTFFSVSDGVKSAEITYPAWWKGIGHNVLAIPELDEDQDYLAYVCSVWRDESLRNQLQSWQA